MFNKIDKKQIIIYLITLVLLEGLLISLLWGSEAKLTLMLGIVSIPVAELLVFFMFSSLNKCIMGIAFVIPLLPLSGYIFLRVGLLDYQWIFYTIFYVVSLIALIKNKIYNCINFKNIIIKDKFVRLLLFILLIVSCFFAYDKQLSFMIVLLSFIPFSKLELFQKE